MRRWIILGILLFPLGFELVGQVGIGYNCDHQVYSKFKHSERSVSLPVPAKVLEFLKIPSALVPTVKIRWVLEDTLIVTLHCSCPTPGPCCSGPDAEALARLGIFQVIRPEDLPSPYKRSGSFITEQIDCYQAVRRAEEEGTDVPLCEWPGAITAPIYDYTGTLGIHAELEWLLTVSGISVEVNAEGKCRCKSPYCEEHHFFPEVRGPGQVVAVQGEGGTFEIWIDDPDHDVTHVGVSLGAKVVERYPDEATSAVEGAIKGARIWVPDWMEEVSIQVYDVCGHGRALNIPVLQLHEPLHPPRISVSERGWEGGVYVLDVKVTDKDLTRDDVWEVLSVRLSVDEGALTDVFHRTSWLEDKTYCSEGTCRFSLLFEPPDSWDGEAKLAIDVRDFWGLSAHWKGVVTNSQPSFEPSSLSEKKTVYYSGGGGSGYSQGPYLLMSPAWAHTYCLTVTDPDGDDLKIGLGSSPRHGVANVLASRTGPGRYNVTIGYQLSNDKLREIHESGGELTDSFTLVVDDGHGGHNDADVTITIVVPNRAPTAGADTATTYVAQPVTISVLANDSDPEGDRLSVTAVTDPAHGRVTITGEGITYTPEARFCGSDAFSYTISDGYGGEATGNVSVTVVDNVPPQVKTKAFTVHLDENGQATITPQDVDDGSTDNCGIASMSVSPDSFTCANLGENTVTLTVTDTSGNQASAQATVTVVDDIPPVLTVPADITIECGESTDPTNTGQAKAEDNCDSTPEVTYSDTTSGSCPWVVTRTWKATDASGNFTTGVQHITVEDTTPPSITVPNDIQVETHDPTGAVVTFTVTADDACDSNPTVTCTPASGSKFPVGTTTVTCKATDACGNVSETESFTVTVTFVNHPPVAYDAEYFVSDWSQPVLIHLQASDPDGDPLTYEIVSGPEHGILSGTPPDLVYIHSGGGIAVDWFEFRVFDGYEYSNTATVVIDPPPAGP